MGVRTLTNRLSLVTLALALTLALVFSPSIVNADEPPQSGAGETQGDSQTGPVPNSNDDSNGDLSGEQTGDHGDNSDGGAKETAPAFGATYLDLIIDVVEEDPGMSVDEISEAVGLPLEGPLSLIHEGEKLSVSVSFATVPTPSEVEEVGRHAEVRRVLDVAPVIMGYAKPTALADLRDVPGVVEVEVNLTPDTAVEDKELTEQEEAQLRVAMREAAEQEAAEQEPAAASSSFKKSCRSIPAAANGPLRVTEAHREWGVNGAGVTVGILSTTYDENPYALTDAEEDVQNGLLPGKGNPCGYTQPVEVLSKEGETPSYLINDEGRAMAQIVHGIAPGAKIIVNTLGQSQNETAQNIADLVAAGADIIADDIFWSNEPSFQKGVISQQVDKAKAVGVSYFSASGNNNGVQETGAPGSGVGYPLGRHQSNKYVPTRCPSWVKPPEGATSYDCMDFSPDGSGVPYGKVKGTPALGQDYAWLGEFTHVLNWSEPMNGVKTQLQLQFYGALEHGTGTFCFGGASAGSSTEIPSRTAKWTEGPNCTPMTDPQMSAALVVVRDTSTPGYGNPMVRITPFAPNSQQRASWSEFHKTQGNNVIQGSQFGHNGDGSAASVAAAPFYDPTKVETFSSLGGNQQWFEPVQGGKVAKALPQKVTPPSPVLLGLDGIPTSFFGGYVYHEDHGEFRAFFGTSAAAPTAAAVAALGLEKNPNMSPAAVLKLLEDSADKNVSNPYSVAGTPKDRVVGAGLINAQGFLNKVPKQLTVTRLAGVNRYATNDAVNRKFGVKGGPVFVATGADFADALSVGPVVGMTRGTLFLTPRKSIDQKTLNQIKSLNPSAVYVVGGAGAVSGEVLAKVGSAAGKKPIRVSGENRYKTSEAIYKRFFADTGRSVSAAFVATGRDFPDALSAASAGAALQAPVLLVNGKSQTSLSPYLAQSLKDKKVSELLISGGVGAVNKKLETDLKRSFKVERLSGVNRYSTNAAVNAHVGKRAGSTPLTDVFIATGRDFPDALSVAAPAGTLSSRLVLSNGACIPQPVVSGWINGEGSRVGDVYLAGGTGVLKSEVEKLTQCK